MAIDPVTFLTVASTGMQVFGGLYGAKEESKAYREQARAERISTEFNIENMLKQGSALLGTQRALRAGAGVETATGTSLMVEEATINEIVRSATQVAEEGAARAKAAERGAKTAQRAGTIGAFGSLLSGATSLAGAGKLDTFFGL